MPVETVARVDRDADGEPDVEGMTGERDRLRKNLEQLVGEMRCTVGLVLSGLDNDELVAAEARGELVLGEKPGDALGGGLQELVAGCVPMHVVDLLEPVEVEHHQGHLAVARQSGGDFVFQPLLERGAVRQPRKRVEMRKVHDALFGRAPFAQVTHGEDAPDGTFRLRVAHDDFHRDGGLVRDELRLEALRRAVAAIVDDLPDGGVAQRRRATRPNQPPHAFVEIQHSAPVSEDEALDRSVGDVAELRLGFLAGAARNHGGRNAGADQKHGHGGNEIAEHGGLDCFRRDRNGCRRRDLDGGHADEVHDADAAGEKDRCDHLDVAAFRAGAAHGERAAGRAKHHAHGRQHRVPGDNPLDAQAGHGCKVDGCGTEPGDAAAQEAG